MSSNKKFGKMFPGGNKDDICPVIEQLLKREVAFQINVSKLAQWVVQFDESEISKLPTYYRKPYLPTSDKAGFEIYEITNELEFLKP